MINFDEIKKQSVGRWPGIFQALGISVGDGRHCPCPVCGGKDRYKFDNLKGQGTWICNQCGAGDGWALLQKVLDCDFKTACEQVAGIVGKIEPSKVAKDYCYSSPEVLNKMFLDSRPITKNCLVGLYLASRGLEIFPKVLRYTKNCYEPETHKGQHAMLAIMSRVDGQAVMIQHTFLDVVTCGKMDVKTPRRYTNKCKKFVDKNDKLSPSAIRLFPPEHGQIGIAEGIETAIACVQKFDIPTWAATNAGLLQSFEPPPGIKQVHIFGDNDPTYTGQAAAYHLANRLVVHKKIDVVVHIPNSSGDWLDNINEEV